MNLAREDLVLVDAGDFDERVRGGVLGVRRRDWARRWRGRDWGDWGESEEQGPDGVWLFAVTPPGSSAWPRVMRAEDVATSTAVDGRTSGIV